MKERRFGRRQFCEGLFVSLLSPSVLIGCTESIKEPKIITLEQLIEDPDRFVNVRVTTSGLLVLQSASTNVTPCIVSSGTDLDGIPWAILGTQDTFQRVYLLSPDYNSSNSIRVVQTERSSCSMFSSQTSVPLSVFQADIAGKVVVENKSAILFAETISARE